MFLIFVLLGGYRPEVGDVEAGETRLETLSGLDLTAGPPSTPDPLTSTPILPPHP